MSLFLVAAILFVIGSGLVALERPGWSRTGFILEFVAGIVVLIGLLT